jgi:peptide-methionine (S)-S-oxide reductase
LHRDVDLRILQTPRGARSGIAISGIDAKDGQHEIRSGEHGHSTAQKAAAEEVIARLEKAKLWSNSIVTEFAPAGAFHEAEGYHQGYFERNPGEPYCQVVVRPEVAEFRKRFLEKLKA